MNAHVNASGGPLRAILVALIVLTMFFVRTGSAGAEVRVTASIPPVHSLAAQVMAGAGVPRLLIAGGTSPHGFALSPSQARLLAESRVLLWIGPGLETTLAKPIAVLAKNARVVTLSRAAGLVRHKVRDLDGDGDHGRGHDREHDHGPGAEDPHYWLDPLNAKAMVGAIADALEAADPANKDLYARNAAAARAGIDAMTAAFQRRLAPLRNRPFVVFHDAYQYLERRFGLTAAGVLAVDPDRPPGARHVSELRERIRRLNVVCLFTEPQFPSRLAEALVADSGARIATLDPLGSGLAPGPALYGDMMAANLRALVDCLR